MAISDMLESLYPKNTEEVHAGDYVPPKKAGPPAEKPWDIRMSSVPVDGKEPLLKQNTRFNYVHTWLPVWKEAVRFRSYSMVLALIGIATLLYMPVVGIAALFGASYYHMQGEMRKARLLSSRKVMWAQ